MRDIPEDRLDLRARLDRGRDRGDAAVLIIAPPPTIYLHSGATDMRKSCNGLSGIIRGSFGGDPADGSLFLFVNNRRDRIKALWWDGDGYVL